MAPVVEIDLDRKRTIVLDINAFAAIEEALPEVNTLKVEFWGAMSAKRAIVVLWASLLREDPSIKLEDVKKIMGGRNLAPVIEKLLEAYGLSTPEPKEAEEEDGEDPQKPEANPNPST